MAKDRKHRDDTEAQLKALGHEVRRAIMGVFVAQGVGTPVSPREVSGMLRQPLSNVSYHVRVLADCGAIKLVTTRPVRGSMQHFYRPSAKFVGQPWVASVLGLDATAEAA
jgi:DNA-binding transcriptional ArsR family regulator